MKRRTIRLYYLRFRRWYSCKRKPRNEKLIEVRDTLDHLQNLYSDEEITDIIRITLKELRKRKKEKIALQENELEKLKADYTVFLRTINEF